MSPHPPILIVEDEPAIRLFAHEILRDNGYEVVSVASADEGLVVLQNRPEIATVMTDVFVPGTLDGMALISEVRRRWPAKKIIVVSGKIPAGSIADSDNTVFLAKPYGEGQLLEAIASARADHA